MFSYWMFSFKFSGSVRSTLTTCTIPRYNPWVQRDASWVVSEPLLAKQTIRISSVSLASNSSASNDANLLPTKPVDPLITHT